MFVVVVDLVFVDGFSKRPRRFVIFHLDWKLIVSRSRSLTYNTGNVLQSPVKFGRCKKTMAKTLHRYESKDFVKF